MLIRRSYDIFDFLSTYKKTKQQLINTDYLFKLLIIISWFCGVKTKLSLLVDQTNL